MAPAIPVPVPSCGAVHAQAVAPRYVNPSGLVHPNGYTHVIVASDGRTAYVAGQVAFDSTGKVVGAGDFARQADQVYANLKTALASVCASFENVLKTTTFITDVRNIPALREARGRYLDSSHPPTNTLVSVSSWRGRSFCWKSRPWRKSRRPAAGSHGRVTLRAAEECE